MTCRHPIFLDARCAPASTHVCARDLRYLDDDLVCGGGGGSTWRAWRLVWLQRSAREMYDLARDAAWYAPDVETAIAMQRLAADCADQARRAYDRRYEGTRRVW